MGSIDNDRVYVSPTPSYYTYRQPRFKAYQFTANMQKNIHRIFSKYGVESDNGWYVTISSSPQDYRNSRVGLGEWIVIDEYDNLVDVVTDKVFHKYYEPQF